MRCVKLGVALAIRYDVALHLALRIPKPLAKQARISQGSLVEIKLVDDVLQIEAIMPEEYTLKALLEAVTDENKHDEIDTGQAQGEEVW